MEKQNSNATRKDSPESNLKQKNGEVLSFSEGKNFQEEVKSSLNQLQTEIEGTNMSSFEMDLLREFFFFPASANPDVAARKQRENIELENVGPNEKAIKSWGKETLIIASEGNVKIKDLDVRFPDTKEGWEDASRSANLINSIKMKFERQVMSAKKFRESRNNPSVDLWGGTFKINENGELVFTHVPLHQGPSLDTILGDGATTILTKEAWNKFPRLSTRKTAFVEYLKKEFGQ